MRYLSWLRYCVYLNRYTGGLQFQECLLYINYEKFATVSQHDQLTHLYIK